MRQPHSTITPAVVRATAQTALARALPWTGYGRRVTAARLLHLLLLVAALRSSLSAVARRFRFGFSHETARQALAAQLPAPDALTAGLLDALYAFGRRAWRRRRHVVAIDLHYCPFYGDRCAPGVLGGQKKQGTHHFYGSATAVLLHRGARYTVGVLALTPGGLRPHLIVRTLLDQMAARGLSVRGVVLDSGFDSANALRADHPLRLLQRRGLSYAVPLRRKGVGPNSRNDWFTRPLGEIAWRSWCAEDSRRAVRTRTVVRRRPHDGQVQVLAFGGWGVGRAQAALRRRAQHAGRQYAARFGIETSYRQLNQGKGRTTKKDVAYRLLLVGLGLLLRQVWVWLTAQVTPPRNRRRGAWVAVLPLTTAVQWLADELRRKYRESKAVALAQPLLSLAS